MSKLLAPAAGAGTGLIFFLQLSWWFGRPIIPTAGAAHRDPMADVVRPQAAIQKGPPKNVYDSVCTTCHQADGKGLPGAFPPVAGSEWVTGDPETPIRIVLLGLGGPIEVAGAKFNAVMPPPAGLTDAQIAEAVTHVRSHFGNKASAVDEAKVAEVRKSLAGRTNPWTAAELTALRAAAPVEAPAAGTTGADGGAGTSAQAAPAPAEDPGPGAAGPAVREAPPAPAEPVPVKEAP
jgi:mono/diheme cytochrome c family protein